MTEVVRHILALSGAKLPKSMLFLDRSHDLAETSILAFDSTTRDSPGEPIEVPTMAETKFDNKAYTS